MRLRARRFRAIGASLIVVLSIGAVTAWAMNRESAGVPDTVALSAAGGSIKIYNSKSGKSILSASGMVPGETVKGTVRIGNPNQQPISITLEPGAQPQGTLAKSLKLKVDDTTTGRAQKVYSGSLSKFKKLSLGEFATKSNRKYRFTATLPSSVGNSIQGTRTSIKFIWRATEAGPPPECRVKAMRARFFIFRHLPFVRLVTRYKATAPGRIVIRFFWRRPGNKFGRQVGQMTTRFGRSPDKFKLKRVWLRRTSAQLNRLRRAKRGFMAQIRPVGSPGYCRSHLNIQLSDLRRKFGQFVWFQKGSFRRR